MCIAYVIVCVDSILLFLNCIIMSHLLTTKCKEFIQCRFYHMSYDVTNRKKRTFKSCVKSQRVDDWDKGSLILGKPGCVNPLITCNPTPIFADVYNLRTRPRWPYNHYSMSTIVHICDTVCSLFNNRRMTIIGHSVEIWSKVVILCWMCSLSTRWHGSITNNGSYRIQMES